MLLLGTVYVFSIILAVFLAGLAIGSGGRISLILRHVRAASSARLVPDSARVRIRVDRIRYRPRAAFLERRRADHAECRGACI